MFPSYSTITSMALGQGRILNATLGGMFMVEDGKITEITTMDGLYRSDPSAIVLDEEGSHVIAGYIDGMIDVIDLNNKEVNRLEDIKRVERFNDKGIHDFKVYNGKVYVATSFGIVVYNLDNVLVESSFFKLGGFATGTQVNALDITPDSIYAATTQGLAVASLDSNLIESRNWTNYDQSNGLPAEIVRDVEVVGTTIYSLVGKKVFIFDGNNWSLAPAFSGYEVNTISKNTNLTELGAATDNALLIAGSNSNVEVRNLTMESSITGLLFEGEKMYVGTSNEGLLVLENLRATPEKYLPTGPYLNFFNELLFDKGALVATSTTEFPNKDPYNSIRGYYIYKDGTWRNYNRNTSSAMAGTETVFTVGMNDSSYYLGSWGKGIIKHHKSDNKITRYDRSNSNLIGISAAPNYVVISGLDSDLENNMWAVSYDAEFPLYVQLNGKEEWTPFRGRAGSAKYYRLFIDSFDHKWISLITNTNSGLGLLVMDTGDAQDPNDDTFVKLTSNQNNGNLPDEKVNAFVQDKNDEVWIGTARGIARFIFPEFIVEGSAEERQAQWLINEDTTAVSRYLLRDVNVTAMAVNDANQKWIGSENQGLWLLNAEGTRIEKRFTAANSSLISDNIKSIEINNETGEVYIATDLGLVSYQDIPKKAVHKMDKLKVYPNPFQYGKNTQIVIEGLSDATRIKILGVDGFVVNELETHGGRVSWDGFDYNGNKLGSGVYFVVAYTGRGREKGIGKVVIIK